MDYCSKVISHYVESFENLFSRDFKDYTTYLNMMANTKLVGINGDDVRGVLRPFLYGWGRMGRVLGGKEYRGWETKLAKQIRTNCSLLESFKASNIDNTSLGKYQLDIEKSYESFRQVIGNIASAKALHLICPNFFPAWDNRIADGVRDEFLTKGGYKTKPFTGADYYAFMYVIQNLMKTHDVTLVSLSKKYNKSKMKILDEFLWWAANRPLSVLKVS